MPNAKGTAARIAREMYLATGAQYPAIELLGKDLPPAVLRDLEDFLRRLEQEMSVARKGGRS
jgi:hypothetical protein